MNVEVRGERVDERDGDFLRFRFSLSQNALRRRGCQGKGECGDEAESGGDRGGHKSKNTRIPRGRLSRWGGGTFSRVAGVF